MRRGLTVCIDSACDIHYSSFYIEGLRRLGIKYRFTSKYFGQFRHNNHFFPLVAESNGRQYKIVIDFADTSRIDQLAYDWCDVYAKINIDFGDLEKNRKLFSIGPSFGVKIYPTVPAAFRALANFLSCRSRVSDKRRFFSDYNAQRKRFALHQYEADGNSQDDYIYFASSLWKLEPETNTYRANFIRAARTNPKIRFEGGFAPRVKNDIEGFEDLTMPARENVADYLRKTKQSLVAFNTPAVLKCHGWKLGEFFALGKAILSTAISRELPRPLVDGQHLLITDGSQHDMESKINRLLGEPELKGHLETSVREYYAEYLAPEKVVESIFARLGIS